MWIFTTTAFVSVVADPGRRRGLVCRARVRGDLDALRQQYLPELSPTECSSTTDYPYRGRCSKAEFARALTKVICSLEHVNFKSEVARVQGIDRAHLYADVWAVMHDAERKLGLGTKRGR